MNRLLLRFHNRPRLTTTLTVAFTLAAWLPLGSQTVTTVAGGYSRNSASNIVSFVRPAFVAQNIQNSSTQDLYVTDPPGQYIWVRSSSGVVAFAGTGVAGFSGDGGAATSAKVNFPNGITRDSAGNVIFADTGNNRIRKIDTSGKISTIAGNGQAGYSGDGGPATLAALNQPFDLTYDSAGSLYFSELGNSVVRKVDTSGTITTFAGTGVAGFSGDGGAAIQARLNGPMGLAMEDSGLLYIADNLNHRVRLVNSSGVISTFAGNGSSGYSGDGGAATDAAIDDPRGLLVYNGKLGISNAGRCTVRSVDLVSSVINTYAGSVCGYDGGRNSLLNSKFLVPTGLLLGAHNDIYIVDSENARLRQENHGTVQTVLGGLRTRSYVLATSISNVVNHFFCAADAGANGVVCKYYTTALYQVVGDGISGFASDEAWYPNGVTIIAAGGGYYNYYFSDTNNKVIRELANSTGVLSTVASDSRFDSLGAMTSDSQGNLYTVDRSACVVWKITPSGMVSIAAGVLNTCGFNGTRIPATAALLNTPYGVWASKGVLYIADSGNNLVRRVGIDGIITTLAGNGSCGFSGDGGSATAAKLCFPKSAVIDSNGTLYIADTSNRRIRRVVAGVIDTYAGTGDAGYNGDHLAALFTNMDAPVSVSLNDQNVVYYLDEGQSLARKIE